MSANYGQIPMLGSFGSNTMNAAATGSNSLMNRAKAAFSTPKMFIMMGMGLVLIVFIFLVLYNRTVGTQVRDGWEKVKTLLRNKGVIDVELDPGNTGEAPIKARLDPEPSVVLPPLTAALLPEPVTVPKPADNPPDDNVHVAAADRPAGMPGSAESTSISKKILEDVKEAVPGKMEVFNISRNVYTFNDAAAVCKAAGAELATYDQVKAAYDGGADWCNYGWIKGQMAVYPTQKSTWQKLQKGAPEFRNACGQPGVNGGYFDNPDLQFGVNCYGAKPAQKASDELLDSKVALPQSAAEIEFEKQVQRFRDQMDAATVLPFHKGQWNE